MDSPDLVSFVPLAKKTVQNALSHHLEMNVQLARKRVQGIKVSILIDYAGHYPPNNGNDFSIDITLRGKFLRVNVQGFFDVTYDVYHYRDNVFVLDCDRDAQSKRIVYPNTPVMMHKLFFKADSEGKIISVRWAHNFTYLKGETFMKQVSDAAIKI